MLETRRWTRALPVTAALLVVGIVAALLSPAVRHQLSLSFQRQSAHYVELYFPDETAARACAITSDGKLQVAATVRSHLAAPAALPYSVSVTGSDGTTASAAGVVSTTPGTASAFTANVVVPSAAYTVQVQLTGRSERLLLHCDGQK